MKSHRICVNPYGSRSGWSIGRLLVTMLMIRLGFDVSDPGSGYSKVTDFS